jgi:hypothetical protein
LADEPTLYHSLVDARVSDPIVVPGGVRGARVQYAPDTDTYAGTSWTSKVQFCLGAENVDGREVWNDYNPSQTLTGTTPYLRNLEVVPGESIRFNLTDGDNTGDPACPVWVLWIYA